MSNQHVLIIDDDREMRASLVDLLESAGWQACARPRAAEAAQALVDFSPDVILSDVRMPGMSGLELLQAMPSDAPPVVLISAHGDIPTAVEAMQNGAYSFVEKPFDPRRLLTILSHAADQYRMRKANQRLSARLMSLAGLDRVLLGETAEILQVREQIADLSDSRAAVLIRGETGTGKELVARSLHDLGPGRGQPFVALNSALLTAGDLATQARAADGGTLFLDEISSCPLDVQAMLLRLIEEQQITAPGATSPVQLDIRVLSATNEDVEDAVTTGRLRRDLLFRLNTTVVALPTLRARADDIVLLARHFLTQISETYEIAAPDLTSEDIAALLRHAWPGNVRELRAVVERRVLAARRGAGDFASAIHPGETLEDIPSTLREAVAVLERELIGRAIRAHDGRMEAVAEALGIGRRTLNDKIVKLGLDKDALL